MKYWLIIFFFLLCNSAKSQNYAHLNDSLITEIVESNYDVAKQNYLDLRLKGKEYCATGMLILNYSLLNGDTLFFKETLSGLIRNFGFYIDEQVKGYSFYDKVNNEKVLRNYYDSIYIANYPKWQADNLKNIRLREEILSILYWDQRFAGSTEYTQSGFQSKLVLDNFERLLQITWQNDSIIPSSENFGYPVSKAVNLIVWHALKSDPELWFRLEPFQYKSYNSGIAPNYITGYVDMAYYLKHGIQYFGTLSDTIPIKDSLTLFQRQQRWGLRE